MNGNNGNNNIGIVYIRGGKGMPGAEARHIERLRRDCPALDWRVCAEKTEAAALLPSARAILTWVFPEEWNNLATDNLRLVSSPSAGRELVRAHAAPGRVIRFGTFHGELMAETVVGLMLAFTRGIRDSLLRGNKGWHRGEIADGMIPLRGSHAVILGFGHVGKWVGRMVKPFGVRITGVNRSDMTRPDYFADGDRVVPMEQLDAVIPEADHFILVLPGDTGTTNIIDARRLGLMKPTAYLYNMGRGNAIDLDALSAVLAAGKIRGAGLDVFPVEPLGEDSPIRTAPNTLLLPHVSAFAPNYLDLYFEEISPVLKGLFHAHAP